MEELEHLLPSAQGDGKSLLAAQLSVWKLETGDRKGAADLADQSAASAASAAARNLSAICRAISHPETNTPESAAASGYARLFTGRFGEAVPYLEAVYRANDPHNDGEIRTMLAWSYVKAGRTMNAAPLIRTYPIPLSAGESIFASWIFPRYLFVRGEVLRQEGKRAEAKAAYELFLKYAGDIPDAFGDEAAARKNLSAL